MATAAPKTAAKAPAAQDSAASATESTEGQATLQAPADDLPEGHVWVNVPGHFGLTVGEFGQTYWYNPNTKSMPAAHAEHEYAIAHGVTKVE